MARALPAPGHAVSAAARPIPDHICIVMLTAVGDAVHVLPVLHALERANPAARITWVLQPGAAALVRGHPAVHELLVFERSRGWRAFLDLRRQLAERRFDLVLMLQDYLKAGVITSFVHAPRKIGLDRARSRDASWIFTTERLAPGPLVHMQDMYLEFLDHLGVPRDPLVWNLGPWPEERAWQREFFAPFARPAAAMVVGTSKPQKDWPPERWAEVADRLYEDHGLQPVLVGGRSAAEQRAEEIVMARARHTPVSALGSGLRRLVSILDGAALVLSPDTGPLHMAVALDRPVISLMGYTNPRRSGPYRRFHDLVVDAYGDPGERYALTMETRPDRMARITVEQVMERVGVWEARYRER
ncbi:MAG TPA: glycosyltransferase family 9 protein [Gemmatimonadaceae bacterium]|nr:glycosyltransferase family 9 protein [Gemmatimonadaceae bacterium]